MRQWGDKKDYLYYITEFEALERKNDEYLVDFSKRFNKMHSKIPVEINPIETSTKLTYDYAFDADFSLSLRERRVVSLVNMQEVSLEVESNIMVADRTRFKP